MLASATALLLDRHATRVHPPRLLPACLPACRLSSSLLDSSKPPDAQGKPWPAADKAAGSVSSGAGTAPAPADAHAPTDAALPIDSFGERDLRDLEARLKWVLEPGSPEAAAALAALEAQPLEVFSMVRQEMARFERSLGLVSGCAAVAWGWLGWGGLGRQLYRNW